MNEQTTRPVSVASFTDYNSQGSDKYLSKEDCGTAGLTLTIAGVTEEKFTEDDGYIQWKPVLAFSETTKTLSLNKTNRNFLVAVLGVDNPLQVIGRQIGLWNDPSVDFKGTIVGGIRLRAAAPPAPLPLAPDGQTHILPAQLAPAAVFAPPPPAQDSHQVIPVAPPLPPAPASLPTSTMSVTDPLWCSYVMSGGLTNSKYPEQAKVFHQLLNDYIQVHGHSPAGLVDYLPF